MGMTSDENSNYISKEEKVLLTFCVGCLLVGIGYKLGLKKAVVFDGDYKGWIAKPVIGPLKHAEILKRINSYSFMYAYDSKDPTKEIIFLQ